MKYSVYDYTRRVYDYYDAPGPGGTHAGSPPKASAERVGDGVTGDLGVSPMRASWKLPMGAARVGSGELPQGRIASLDGSDGEVSTKKLLVYAALGYLAWKVIR
jgi:hypothetical protein